MNLKDLILDRINDSKHSKVWTAFDFLDLGSRDSVDKVLQRLVKSNLIRRVDRGLYDIPRENQLTGQSTAPDYKEIISAISRRDQARMLIDGLTSANDLGLTNAVPGQVNVLTDCRLKPIQIDSLVIKFKYTAPSKLYWAGRPGMRVIQALYWLREIIDQDSSEQKNDIQKKLVLYLKNHKEKEGIVDDLKQGIPTLPAWMQSYLKQLLLVLESSK